MGQRPCPGRGWVGALLVTAWLLAGCGTPTLLRPVAPAPTTAPSAETLAAVAADSPAALLLAERNGAAARDLASLAVLWDADARLVEARGAPGPADDYTWQGRDAILDRYIVAVFPNPPPLLAVAPDVPLTVDGDSATLQHGVDTWHFVRRAGRWWIKELMIQDW
jgi:hypothetical protein